MNNIIKILGVDVNKITLDEATNKIKEFLNEDETKVVYTPNTEIIMETRKDQELKSILNEGNLVVPDGIGLVYASRIKKKPLPERVTGFDLSVKILEVANELGYSLYLLGGKEGVSEEAALKIKEKYPNIKIAGCHNGYFKGTHTGHIKHEEENKIINEINASGADILFVGFGAPKQEKWIKENKDSLNCKVIIGNGGTIDVLAEKVKRAPEIYQKLGLEWLYRLIKEPKRIKRQIVLPLFILIVLFSRDNVVE